jgi:hypothetical protein
LVPPGIASAPTFGAGFRAKSLASFALWALRAWAADRTRIQAGLCGLAAAVQGIEDCDAVNANYYRLALNGE